MNANENITNIGNNITVFAGTEPVPIDSAIITAKRAVVESQPHPLLSVKPDYDQECSICLTEIHSNKDIYEIPCCKKKFHRTCLLRWYDYTQDKECPLCKQFVDVTKIMEPPQLSIYQRIRNFICQCETRCPNQMN